MTKYQKNIKPNIQVIYPCFRFIEFFGYLSFFKTKLRFTWFSSVFDFLKFSRILIQIWFKPKIL